MSRPSSALIVDDESHVRTFLRLLLLELGIDRTWEARDGQQALSAMSLYGPDLVLLDLNMPGMHGIEVLRELLRIQPDTPVIIVSAQGTLHSVQEAVRVGAVGYVLKHGRKDDMLLSLREALDNLEEEPADLAEPPRADPWPAAVPPVR